MIKHFIVIRRDSKNLEDKGRFLLDEVCYLDDAEPGFYRYTKLYGYQLDNDLAGVYFGIEPGGGMRVDVTEGQAKQFERQIREQGVYSPVYFDVEEPGSSRA